MGVIFACLLTAAWVALFIGPSEKRKKGRTSKGKASKAVSGHTSLLKSRLLTEPFVYALARACKWHLVQQYTNSYHARMLVLNGPAWTGEASREKLAQAFGAGFALLWCCSWLSWIGGEGLVLLIGFLLFIVLAFRTHVEAGRQLEKRRRLIVAALPDKLSKLMLLVGAGETVQGAFHRCAESYEASSKHPLDREWAKASLSLANGESFGVVMERFSRQCAVQEAAVFTAVLLLNYKRGGEHFTLALRELSYSLWEKRKALARTRGEEASSKLVFPLAAILFIMMIIVAAPAVLMMS
ncbi:type II secretion system F family protein [Paenibacillus sp. CAU 1782]